MQTQAAEAAARIAEGLRQLAELALQHKELGLVAYLIDMAYQEAEQAAQESSANSPEPQ